MPKFSPRLAVAVLSLSGAGLVATALNEGYTSGAVIPVPGDVPTIGFGATENVHIGDTTTPPRALERLLRDVGVAERGVKGCVTAPLTQSEYDVYVDHSFNIGVGAFCKSTMVRKLNALDYAGACAEFSRYVFQHGRDCRDPANKCSGLVKRRERQRAACEGN